MLSTALTSKLKVNETSVEGVLLLEPKVFGDSRGLFWESYNEQVMAEVGITARFVQDNQSLSQQNVLRGLHYQIPQAQGKLVRTVFGEIFDVAVDLRRSSPTFGRWTAARLSAENRKMMWIPAGCAHGFLVTSEKAEVLYKTTDFYAPDFECTIRWNDPELAIEWPIDGEPVLSKKDMNGVALSEAKLYP
jgi:dTDP-4-dehydrorhamnose 3,5-epimerase